LLAYYHFNIIGDERWEEEAAWITAVIYKDLGSIWKFTGLDIKV
jgi:hypothetical protein